MARVTRRRARAEEPATALCGCCQDDSCKFATDLGDAVAATMPFEMPTKPCPWCGSREVEVCVDGGWSSGYVAYIQCGRCLGTGPVVSSTDWQFHPWRGEPNLAQVLAALAWNRRERGVGVKRWRMRVRRHST